ncbi:MAG TPA: DUF1109 domain-containing protein [Kofleriaceae bacterium]|jgi:hypothetical protein|nr:DUF1109 domain-containing protein [Kofleriaceae bacterium]
MNREVVIQSLVAELTPVRRLRSVDTRASLWAGLAIACVALGCYGLGMRPDLSRKLSEIAFLAESVALIAIFASAARCAFQLGVPGVEPSAHLRIAPALAAFAWIFLVARRWSAGPAIGAMFWTEGLLCIARIAGLTLVPLVAIFVMLRRGAPRARGRTGILALVSATALAAAGTRLICAKDGAAHVLVWHAVPVAFAALVGIAAGRALLRCERHRRPCLALIDVACPSSTPPRHSQAYRILGAACVAREPAPARRTGASTYTTRRRARGAQTRPDRARFEGWQPTRSCKSGIRCCASRRAS